MCADACVRPNSPNLSAMVTPIAACSPAEAITSAQLRADGSPRFEVTPWGERFAWSVLRAAEESAGVASSIRVFLDAQLESGDLVVDISPAAGFVSLSAATADAEPHVISLVSDADHEQAVRDAAEHAGVFIECVVQDAMQREDIIGLVADRLLDGQRVFVHADAEATSHWLNAFSVLADTGRLIAWCVSGGSSPDGLRLAHASLVAHGFSPQLLAEVGGDAQLFPAPPDADEWIALHSSVLSPEADVDDAPTSSVRSDAVVHPVQFATTRTSALHFIAPFCRTGYGVAGAHLLRALMLRDAAVSFFPLGAVDSSVLPFAGLLEALAGQDSFDPMLPSVRLSQQFDLAMHVGRGPHIGFPIFELSRFTARERHHLSSQDRLLVCSEWARNVLLENGVSRTPIDVVPLGVDRGVFHEKLDAGPARDDTVFLQVGKLESRKGQLALLQAFEAAFTPKDAVRLVLACHNPFLDSESFNRATMPFRKSPMSRRITVHAKPFATQHDIARLMATADCGVFASRAEGWNLEALEMLSVGRAVIATNYSAHTEFLSRDNARLINIDALEQAPGGTEGAEWAAWGASQHEQLVAHLQAVHAARQSGSLPHNEAGIETAERYSWDNAAVALLTSLGSV